MRIAQVAPLYESVPPKLYGGTERVVSWLTEELVALGHDVTLFASGDSLTAAKLVSVCDRSLRLNTRDTDYLAYHVLLLENLLREKDNFDLIHFHIDYLHFPLSRHAELSQLTTLHGRLDLKDLIPVYREFAEMPAVSISNAQRKPLSWINWQGTVYHGLPEKSLMPCAESGKYLAFLGRIAPEKGVDHAIEIAKRTGIPLKIAAKVDRVDVDYYENKIKPLMNHSLIEFVGEISDHEKREFLGNAMAFLFPINWPEPFGIVTIEALACGVPVIAYPNGSVPEIIDDGVTGFLVHDPKEAALALNRISRIDRNVCRCSFEQRFTSRRMARDYMDIYERLVKSDSRALSLADGDLSWKLELPTNTT